MNRGIHGERYVYDRYVENDYEFLHDLKNDPGQFENLAANPEYREILGELILTL